MSFQKLGAETWDISATQRFFTTATVSIGSIATILTATIMNVAVPDIMGAFGIGQDQAQWVSTAFLAATTCAMLATDWSVQKFGARNTYICAMLFFVLTLRLETSLLQFFWLTI